MNKFDVNDLTNCFKMTVDLKGIKKLEEYIKQLEQENKELHNKIDKAIEYINDNVAVYAFNNKDLPHWEFNDDEIKILLEILKDSDVDE